MQNLPEQAVGRYALEPKWLADKCDLLSNPLGGDAHGFKNLG
jgi:hypothetical protein